MFSRWAYNQNPFLSHALKVDEVFGIIGIEDKVSPLSTKDVDFYILNHDGLATGFTKTVQDRSDIQIIIYDEVSAETGIPASCHAGRPGGAGPVNVAPTYAADIENFIADKTLLVRAASSPLVLWQSASG